MLERSVTQIAGNSMSISVMESKRPSQQSWFVANRRTNPKAEDRRCILSKSNLHVERGRVNLRKVTSSNEEAVQGKRR